jgi:hypothetical protein
MPLPGARLVAAAVVFLLAPGSQDAKPLPDEATFLAEAKRKLASDERLQARYTYKLRRTEVGRNPFGRIGTGDVSMFEVYPSPILELTYYRKISVNGIAVSPPVLAEQDRKQRVKVEDYVRRLRRESARDRERQLEQGSILGQRERAMVADVTASLEYRMERREILHGQPAIVVSFTPKASARPWSSEGKLVKHFKGRVWIDEEAQQIARVEAEAIDTVSFGLGFLVRIGKGTKGTFVRRPLNGDAWLPTEARLVGSGRALLFRRFELDLVSEYFDYQAIDPAAPPSFVALPEDLTKK